MNRCRNCQPERDRSALADSRASGGAVLQVAFQPMPKCRVFRAACFWSVSCASVNIVLLRLPMQPQPTRQQFMNHQQVSEICFEETYTVPSDQTARSLFTRLPHGKHYAETLIECLATGYLIAVVESICIQEMHRQIDPAVEVVVGKTIHLEHCGPIPPGATIRLQGWVERLGQRSATFCIRAYDDHELVCDGKVTLVAADRAAMESKIATKVNGLQKVETVS